MFFVKFFPEKESTVHKEAEKIQSIKGQCA